MKPTCPQCGCTQVEPISVPYRYTQSGLDYVYLVGVEYVRCRECDDRVVSIPNEQRLLELIGVSVAKSSRPLGAKEVRFLRSLAGWSQSELAARLAVARVTVTRWEIGESPLDIHTDIHLRLVWAAAFIQGHVQAPNQVAAAALLEGITEIANRAGKVPGRRRKPRIEIDAARVAVRDDA